jgi:hypothetical protein
MCICTLSLLRRNILKRLALYWSYCILIVNSDLLNNFFETNKGIHTAMLRKALTTTKGETSRVIAKTIKVLFSPPDNIHKPINKYLALMGFGTLTYMP